MPRLVTDGSSRESLVGLLVPISGLFAYADTAMRMGAEMAMEDINLKTAVPSRNR